MGRLLRSGDAVSLLPRELLPPLDHDVAVERPDLHQEHAPAGLLAGDDR
jgi:hypothetical protein